jgi:hypothetical protein
VWDVKCVWGVSLRVDTMASVAVSSEAGADVRPRQLAVKFYDARYRADDAWTVRQMGVDRAVEEVTWWRARVPEVAEALAAAPPVEIDELEAALWRAVTRALGESAVVAAWVHKRKLFVVRRDMCASAAASTVATADPLPAVGVKRERPDEVGDAGGASAAAASTSFTWPRIRPAAAYPSLEGAALYTAACFHSNAEIGAIYASGKVRRGWGGTCGGR